MARDGVFFQKIGELNRFSVPQRALWLQCALASLWCLSGKYGDLLDMISLGVVVFYLLTIVGIFILRVKRPDIPRPYRAFGYPVLPIIYLIMGGAFCLLLVIFKPNYTWPGIIIILIGIPVYFFALKRKKDKS
jgi:APA family basic amino acid/polyamine antiporter